ncbi:biotin--[acetyl-CoA-carboxylase] ligase [Sphingorhabdus arenilitoris]|uniref:biotin--[biotin carboxyl-carrier protein] ligase n=1 Tax=Sphingorhabdus arenilitoris TaxID=1490041 RepID=A0ABV8RGX5_9SPHN
MTHSTNADLIERAKGGAGEGLWLRADRQSGGRGRMGREWISPSGNVYVSGLVRLLPNDPPASTLAFVAAIAVHDILQQLAPNVDFRIKWPNDIMAMGAIADPPAKLCGMLLDRTGDAVIVGIGVNLSSHPETLDRPVTSLLALGTEPPSPQQFTEKLAGAFAELLARWRTYGTQPILSLWQEKSYTAGTILSVQLPDGDRLLGKYDGLTGEGALKLRLDNGDIHAIHAADVFLV